MIIVKNIFCFAVLQGKLEEALSLFAIVRHKERHGLGKSPSVKWRRGHLIDD